MVKPFGPRGPDDAWVAQAALSLRALGARERSRLLDAFENRQDGLLQYLDERGLSDEGYAVARTLLFECFALIELGNPAGTRSVPPGALDAADGDFGSGPEALGRFAGEALRQVSSAAGLDARESSAVWTLCMKGVAALWNARRPPGEEEP